MAFVDGVVIMNEPRCIAQLLRNESPRAIDFTITHGKGRKGIIIRTKKQSPLKKVLTFLKSRRVWKWALLQIVGGDKLIIPFC